ncbi:MAG: hypothetical protein KDB14_35030 [Planctomycetales bacterium]|nr:hypothetical protein [Planctomycetales bacterium]
MQRFHQITGALASLLLFGANLCLAGDPQCPPPRYEARVEASHRVIYKEVQSTPSYDVGRPEVVSGSRVTLFANFLLDQPGYLYLEHDGTSRQCELLEWKPNSVTANLPKVGLNRPKVATLKIVMPDGRIAKAFPICLVSQPDIMIHRDTVPQPLPPAPAAQPAAYASAISGGLMLYSQP